MIFLFCNRNCKRICFKTHIIYSISWRTLVGLSLILAVPPSAWFAWADGNLEEMAEQLGKMVKHPKSKSTQPKFARRMVFLYKYTRGPTES